MQTKSGNRYGSEQLGKRWNVKTLVVRIGVRIANLASYAPYVHGDEQARFHGARGWRKLHETALEQIGMFTITFNKWISRLLKDKGIK